MIAQEFLEELGKVVDQFHWELAAQPQLTEDRRARTRHSVRGRSRNSENVFDPIGAVCYAMTGEVFDEENWMDAAEAINLSLIDAGDLIAATNDRVWTGSDERRQPVPHLVRLRTQLLEHVGLRQKSA